MRGIAEAKVVERVAERNAQVMGAILAGVLADMGVDVSSERVRTLLAARIARETGAVEGVAE